jgi:hypothetical protein
MILSTGEKPPTWKAGKAGKPSKKAMRREFQWVYIHMYENTQRNHWESWEDLEK